MKESNDSSTRIFDELNQRSGLFPEHLQPPIEPTVDISMGGTALNSVESFTVEAPKKIVVHGWLTKTAKDLVQEINQAITEGKTVVGIDTFKTAVERKAGNGYITHTEAASITRAISDYERDLNNLRKREG